MSGKSFKCLQCGTCCRDLFDYVDSQKRGLTLTLDEATLFPENLISPLMAIGTEKPSLLILYQLNVNECPFIDQSNKCMIYEKRPLVCRAFPLTQGSYSTKCKLFGFAKNFPENSVKIAMDWGNIQLEAERTLDQYILENFEKWYRNGIATWSFDLATHQWVLRKRYDNYEGAVSF